MSSTMKHKYQVHKATAKRRGIAFTLTFEEWRDIWLASGKYDLRGVGLGKYCMCRFGDKGGYDVDNVFIGEFNKNSKEANTGRIQSESKREKLSNIAKGRKQSANWVANRVASYIQTCNNRNETQGA